MKKLAISQIIKIKNTNNQKGHYKHSVPFKAIFEVLFSKNGNPKIIDSVKIDLNSLYKDKDFVVWFGHSSILLYLNGKKILIDPILQSNASPFKSFIKPFNGADIYSIDELGEIDYLLITHNHYDHLNKDNIKKLKDKVERFLLPLGVGKYITKWGVNKDKIVELDWQDEYQNKEYKQIGGNKDEKKDNLRFHFLPTRHFSGRYIIDSNKSLWGAYLIETNKHKIYIGGDSGYGVHYKQTGEKFGNIDLAFLENGQYNMAWRDIHLFPQDTLKAALDLNAKSLFPLHNSKFKLSTHSWNSPLDELSKLIKENKMINLLTPKIGEALYIWEENNTKEWWK